MKYFAKLNLLALLYGFALFVVTELMLNCYRLEMIAHWFNFNLQEILLLVLLVVFTIAFCFITKRYFSSGKLKYILSVLWIPYYVILTFLSSYLLPATNRGDDPPPVLGLVLCGLWFIYPFYIAVINVICKKKD